MIDDPKLPRGSRAGFQPAFGLAHLIGLAKKAPGPATAAGPRRRGDNAPADLKPMPKKNEEAKPKRKQAPTPPMGGQRQDADGGTTSFDHLRRGAEERDAATAAEQRSIARAIRRAKRDRPTDPEPTFAERADLAMRRQRGETIEPKTDSFAARALGALRKLGR